MAVQDWIATRWFAERFAIVEDRAVSADSSYPINEGDCESPCETTSRKVLRQRFRAVAY